MGVRLNPGEMNIGFLNNRSSLILTFCTLFHGRILALILEKCLATQATCDFLCKLGANAASINVDASKVRSGDSVGGGLFLSG